MTGTTVFSEDELRRSVQRFIERDYPFEYRRQHCAHPAGSDRGRWDRLADLGLLAIGIGEDAGGLGGGARDMAAIAEELGRGLVAEPWIGCAVLAAPLLDGLASDALRAEILPDVVAGSAILALAHEEAASRGNLGHVGTRVSPSGRDFLLSGLKLAVAGGALADKLLVTARLSGGVNDPDGIGLFLVDPASAGVTLRPYRGYDGVGLAEIGFQNVALSEGALVASGAAVYRKLEEVHADAVLTHSAFALGVMDRAIAGTTEYLLTRRQFGKALAEFQALQHRLVDAHIEAEKTRAILGTATAAHGADRPLLAKARLVTLQAAQVVSRSCTQLHGGIGLTEEYHVGHCTRWLSTAAVQFGTADHWRRQVGHELVARACASFGDAGAHAPH